MRRRESAGLRRVDVISPDGAEYDDARAVFCGWIDRPPRAIVRAADAVDVVRVVGLAGETGVDLGASPSISRD